MDYLVTEQPEKPRLDSRRFLDPECSHREATRIYKGGRWGEVWRWTFGCHRLQVTFEAVTLVRSPRACAQKGKWTDR